MIDLVKRLRERENRLAISQLNATNKALLKEAAARIEELEGAVNRASQLTDLAHCHHCVEVFSVLNRGSK